MKQKDIECILLGTSFLQQYKDGGSLIDSDIKELLEYGAKLSKKYIKNTKNIEKYTESAYYKLEKITNGKDVDVNVLVLSVSFFMLLMENKAIGGSESMKVKRLTNSIYNKVEPIVSADMLHITNKLVKEFDLFKE